MKPSVIMKAGSSGGGGRLVQAGVTKPNVHHCWKPFPPKKASNHSLRCALRQFRHVNGRCCYHGSEEEADGASGKHMRKNKYGGGGGGGSSSERLLYVYNKHTHTCASVHRHVGVHVLWGDGPRRRAVSSVVARTCYEQRERERAGERRCTRRPTLHNHWISPAAPPQHMQPSEPISPPPPPPDSQSFSVPLRVWGRGRGGEMFLQLFRHRHCSGYVSPVVRQTYYWHAFWRQKISSL